jgi:hypothetical protein
VNPTDGSSGVVSVFWATAMAPSTRFPTIPRTPRLNFW